MTRSSPLDAEALYTELLKAVKKRIETWPQPLYLVGITSGGAWLAQRMQHDMGLAGPAGVISSSMHRDDFAQRGLALSAQTVLPFDVNGAHVLLVDDVLYTGRTLRAVINELYDYGRPASVKLAVLVDRGGRELPMAADVCATTVELPGGQTLELDRDESGRMSFVLESKGA
ncbi:MAG: bifunctional pyr operon transcriptional regulator/uracil phosphoribosyltransferase PyrR [Hydrogenophaga sp.]|uniref:bifunctional pyr operon transcriptional regulator/uracil phosphoribosyltransferase PyrR n=1 Tax=Hydrogenophaga sp. TaxID=1904254 RepID=UPI002779B892|nr:bifunctional pyr operon transcriptional regulator/uracil phosphoribosyltransferase PyrR [Hydrogenophaga sp.]MDP2418213.1 bifunctional pyr operon transcriptional regulator/uracil phosphoribosyltransferase PyrR [Hydrogenophaga sp.]MDZ4189836.1 bifunctional pyr operon transcriptional regulator/uracil phosphoribosyltransferase PyrR [Hydrogenophaga sp.]